MLGVFFQVKICFYKRYILKEKNTPKYQKMGSKSEKQDFLFFSSKLYKGDSSKTQ